MALPSGTMPPDGYELMGRNLSPNDLFMRTTFTGDELRNTAPFDPDKQLKDNGGDALLEDVLSLLANKEGRTRALKLKDAASRRLTVSVLLANLAAATLNRVDKTRFVTVSFNRNDYTGTGMSVSAMTLLRDTLLELEMIEGRSGVRSVGPYDEVRSSLTRMRATVNLIDLFEQHEIGYPAIVRQLVRGSIVLKERRPGVDSEPPPDVAQSVPVIARANSLIAGCAIELPSDAWSRVKARHATAATKDKKERADAGDLTATALYRSFKYDWRHGGRLYGGWWIGLPKEERQHLTIDGQRTIEFDYAQFHPSILFAKAGRPLDFDLYTVPGLESPELRSVGKDLFMLLLNREAPVGVLKMPRMRVKEKKLLPFGITPDEYQRRFLAQLDPIRRWLSTGEGTRLQREDSDLVIAILDKLSSIGIVVLPIHDSFIVQERHGLVLREAMASSCRKAYGQTPVIK